MLFSCKSMLSSRSRGKNNRSPLWSLGKFSTMCCWLPFNRKRNSIKSLMAIENLKCTLCRIRQTQDHLFCKRFWGQDTSVKHGALFGLYGIPLSHCSVARALAYSQEGQDPQSRTKNLVQASWYEKSWKILKHLLKRNLEFFGLFQLLQRDGAAPGKNICAVEVTAPTAGTRSSCIMRSALAPKDGSISWCLGKHETHKHDLKSFQCWNGIESQSIHARILFHSVSSVFISSVPVKHFRGLLQKGVRR